MNLHKHERDFKDLKELAASFIGIPSVAVGRDYYIVMLLKKLSDSAFAEDCVFKGGTSLSKCYPGSIERFSEDIDLTYIPQEELGNKQYDRRLKQVEKVMTEGFRLEKIVEERNDRNKSAFVWFDDSDSVNGRIKLEIGSKVRPEPYRPMKVKTYIQEYLESQQLDEEVKNFGLTEVTVNALAIERTFLDKVMSVKRHAICGTLSEKIRHVYDVTRLFNLTEIQAFLANTDELKRLFKLTKETDSFYLQKRNLPEDYTPLGPYGFSTWRERFDEKAKQSYEVLHESLLYTNEKQDFNKAMETFTELDRLFDSIGE